MSALTLTPTQARRLAITRQRLAGPPPAASPEGLLGVVRDLGCLQLDPISAVARSHQLVLWSRVGRYDLADLDTLLWQERSLFEYWAHVASIVLTEDYPVHQHLMRSYARGVPRTPRRVRQDQWLRENRDLRRHILAELHARGPLAARHFEDKAKVEWAASDGWSSGGDVGGMLDYLWTKGAIMVAGRSGIQRLWDLSSRCLPAWAPRERLPEREVVRRATLAALRALGVARPDQIRRHFTRGRYPGLPAVLAELEAERRIQQVEIAGDRDGAGESSGQLWPGPWYVHVDDLPALEGLTHGWEPRTTLLSPFDNLICDRARTEHLFGFEFRVEIYVPAAKRRYGYYVLPILHGDRLIGRIDPVMDRKNARLKVNAVYAEPDAPMDAGTGRAVAGALAELAEFLGAREVVLDAARVPVGWRRALGGMG